MAVLFFSLITCTPVATAGDSAAATNFAGSADQSTISIFSRTEVLHDGAHSGSAGADQGTLRVDAFGVGTDGDLGAGARLAGDGHNRHGAGNQFRNLTLEQAADQLRMGTGHHDFRALHTTGHVHHVHADTFAVTVTFAGHLLAARQNRFDIADGDVHVGWSLTSCCTMPVMSLPF